AVPAEGREGGSRSTHPGERREMEQPHVKPLAGSPYPSPPGAQRAAAETPGAEVGPGGAAGVPGGRGALLRQEAIASQEDGGVLPGRGTLAKALEKGGSQPEPLGPGAERVPAKSRSAEVAPATAGTAGGAAGGQAEVCPGETQADSSIKIEICPWEGSGGERWGPGRALGKGSSEGDPGRPGKESGTEKPPAKPPELLKGASEAAGRAAEVCPWEMGEGGRIVRAEICPWDTAPAAAKEGGQRGSPGPGEGAEQPGMVLVTEHPALPKASAKQAGIIDSKKADVCPWEVEEQPLPKPEICPWEEPAAPSGKERMSQDTRGTSKGENKPGSGGLE
ncbi:GP179 protein, partial [Psophia crepitans]|nr:GP179 protein [Psophia crepitans]